MQPKPLTELTPLQQRLHAIIWQCLDLDLIKSAVFYAERYISLEAENHDARHLYTTVLLRAGQPYSALCVVNSPKERACPGCAELKAKCYSELGQHRQAREALEDAIADPEYVRTASTVSRLVPHTFPDEATLRCRAGTSALKGNQHDRAAMYFRESLQLNPMIWEAFEGLCALGKVPELDVIFPHKPLPVKRSQPEEIPAAQTMPIATGVGFFTPDNNTKPNGFANWRAGFGQPHPFRMGPPAGPRDSIATNDSSFYPENSFAQINRPIRPLPSSQLQPPSNNPAPGVPGIARPLSSADETGPVQKKLRHTGRADLKKAGKSNEEPPAPKKARSRAGSVIADVLLPGRKPQASTSRVTKVASSQASQIPPPAPTRRSTRLLSGANKPPSKTAATRARRQPTTQHVRTQSTDTEQETDHAVPPAQSPSSPRSAASPGPEAWTQAQERAAQEAYEQECADFELYNLMRMFARAARALAKYDCVAAVAALDEIPTAHQNSPWVLSMAGKAHYERQNYAAAERAFGAVRTLEPYRLWDMEIYSSLLWNVRKAEELSYLAQELLNINPHAPQGWLAAGNLFSLQRDRAKALACFRRAFQLDPSCAYAYTLSGQELLDEDADRAINFFQSALRVDARHYNAWYGLGTCYMRMSKIRMAEFHFRKAVEINPKNAVLLGCLGMAVERRNDRPGGLKLFNEAVELQPDNALVRYRRAKIYIAMRRYEDAISDLEFLRNTSPEEANVVFQLAKAYRLAGQEVKALHMVAVARDIAPKSVNRIRKLLELNKDEDEDNRMDEG
ncbi:hypothetical protein EV122DRAFT_275784 [Schizophyllum commune]